MRSRGPWGVVTLFDRPKPTIRSSVAQVEKLLKDNEIISKWDYARDRHFAKYAFDSIKGLVDAEKFLTELDKDNKEQTSVVFRWGCIKAKLIRQYLSKSFWREDVDRIRTAISVNRRVCCSCHETGSFCRLDQLK